MDERDVVIDGVHDESASNTSSGRRAEFEGPNGEQGIGGDQQARGEGQRLDGQLSQSESGADKVGPQRRRPMRTDRRALKGKGQSLQHPFGIDDCVKERSLISPLQK